MSCPTDNGLSLGALDKGQELLAQCTIGTISFHHHGMNRWFVPLCNGRRNPQSVLGPHGLMAAR